MVSVGKRRTRRAFCAGTRPAVRCTAEAPRVSAELKRPRLYGTPERTEPPLRSLRAPGLWRGAPPLCARNRHDRRSAGWLGVRGPAARRAAGGVRRNWARATCSARSAQVQLGLRSEAARLPPRTAAAPLALPTAVLVPSLYRSVCPSSPMSFIRRGTRDRAAGPLPQRRHRPRRQVPRRQVPAVRRHPAAGAPRMASTARFPKALASGASCNDGSASSVRHRLRVSADGPKKRRWRKKVRLSGGAAEQRQNALSTKRRIGAEGGGIG